ncbi:MAG: type II and III secretion system protein family protein, partial [Pseudomonadota bacterium]
SDSAVDFAIQNSFSVSGNALGGLSGNVTTPGFGEIQNLDFAFDVFEQNGLVKTLAEPNLTALSGYGASFLAGGEFPVPEAAIDGVPSVSFKEFGVKLDFVPHVYSKGRIQLKLETEVSEISFATGVSFANSQTVNDQGEVVNNDGFVVPGITARSAGTTIELPSGGSIAIAGLLQENITEFVDGVPGIKETPVLGALFRSQEYQSNQTELVIIATPYLVEPTDLANLTDPGLGHVSAAPLQSVLLGKLEAAYGVKGQGVGEATLQGPLGFILD